MPDAAPGWKTMPDRAATRTLKLTLAYDGSAFVGWQRQAEGTSIQGLIEDALSRIEGAPVAVVGAGRTDAGVHACGQVASAGIASSIDLVTLGRALNAILPPDIRVVGVEQVAAGFHARYSARSKTYRYLIVNGPFVTPFERRFAWHVPWRLDVGTMALTATRFEGEHDFAAFRSTGSHVHTSRRHVHRSRLLVNESCQGSSLPCPSEESQPVEQAGRNDAGPWGAAAGGGRIVYEVTATGFLRHMVRTIIGTLGEIGAGRRDVESIDDAFASGDRASAGATAPAHGLCLVRVDY
jgi:tRNA pseudouridine38-40 synthase